MITAKEARELAQQSEMNVNKFVESLCDDIRKLAEQNKYEYIYTGHKPGDPCASTQMSKFETFKVPLFWTLVMEKLKAYPLSYQVTLYKSEPRMPGGLGATEDSQPYVQYGFLIKW